MSLRSEEIRINRGELNLDNGVVITALPRCVRSVVPSQQRVTGRIIVMEYQVNVPLDVSDYDFETSKHFCVKVSLFS